MAGDVTVANKSAALSTVAGGTTDFIKADFGTPKACKIIISFDAVDDTGVAVESKVSIGFSDFTNNYCISHQDEDASAKVDCDARKSNTKSYVVLDAAGAVLFSGTAGAITDGVRLTHTAGEAPASAFFASVEMYGGVDLKISLDRTVIASAQDSTATITPGADFDTSMIFFIGTDIAGEDSSSSGINNSFGVCHINAPTFDTFIQRCMGWASDHNNNNGSPSAIISTDRVLDIITEAGAQDWGLEVTAAATNSITVTTRDAGAGAGMEVYSLALDIDDRSAEVGSIDSPVVAGNWSKTGLSFKPQCVGLGLNRLTSEDTIITTADAGTIGFSNNTGASEETSHGFYNDNGAATIDTNNSFQTRAILLFNDDGTNRIYELSHSSFQIGGWTYSQNGTPSAIARKWIYWVFEEAAAVAHTGTGVQTLPSLSQVGVGVMQPSGAGAQTLASLTQAGVGVQEFTGTGAQILAALTQAGQGVQVFTGTGAQTLAALVQSAVGVMQPSGAGAQTLAALVQAGAAVEIFVATAVQTLAALTQAGVGAMQPSGAGALTLAALLQSGSGTHTETVTGTGAQTLAALTQAAVGVMQPSGAGAQTLAALVQAGAAVEIFVATAVQTLAALTQAGVGVMQPSGAGAQTLAALVQAGAAVEIFVATAVQTLAALTQAGVAVMQPSGAGAQTLAALTQAAAAVEIFVATAVQTLAALTQAGVAVLIFTATGAQTLAALVQAGVGVHTGPAGDFPGGVVLTIVAGPDVVPSQGGAGVTLTNNP